MTERKSESERAELVAIAGQIDIFIKYGTNAIFEPDDAKKIASALRRLAAQDQKPVALAHVRLEDDGLFADLEVLDGTNLQPSMSPVALYLSPPPAPGWEETDAGVREIISAVLFAKWSGEANGWPDGEWSAPDWGAWRNRTKLNPVGLSRTAFEEEADFLLKEVRPALSKPAPVAANARADDYRDAIDEALVTRFIGVAKGDARAELNQIIKWDVAVALDPRVSSSAQALIDSGRNASAEARLREAITSVADAGRRSVGHVGYANYAERQSEAMAWIREAEDAAIDALSAHPYTAKSEGGLNEQARNPVRLPDGSGDLASAGGIARDDIKDHHRQVGGNSPSDRTSDVTEGWTGQKCPYCKGTGENLSNPMNSGACNKCGGTGDEYGPLSAHPHASDCDKQGEAKCPECGGSGSIEIDDGHFIKCKCAAAIRSARDGGAS